MSNNCPHCGAEPVLTEEKDTRIWKCNTIQVFSNTPMRHDNCRIRDLEQRCDRAVKLLEGYDDGTYGEQGDFYPYPVQESICILKGLSYTKTEVQETFEALDALDKEPAYTAVKADSQTYKGDRKTYSVKVSGDCEKIILDMRKSNTDEPTEDPDKEPGDAS